MVMGLVMPLLLGKVTNVTIIHQLCRLYPQLRNFCNFFVIKGAQVYLSGTYLQTSWILFLLLFNLLSSVNLSSPLLHWRQINYSFYAPRPNFPPSGTIVLIFTELFKFISQIVLTNYWTWVCFDLG